MKTFEVKAHWDTEARVWWAESDDVPGIVAETPTSDAMLVELRRLVPEMLAENEVLAPGSKFQVRIVMDETEDFCIV